jgi:glycerate kinase
VRVLVSPDKFKGTLTATEAARAIGRGWQRSLPAAVIDEVPLADGGEGTLDVLVAALGGTHERMRVTGPLGEPVEAEFGLVPAPGGPAGIVEMAVASGLALVAEARRDPKVTTTRGTGELMVAACRAGARRLIVCVGGSATNDAGAGMAQALGIRLADERGLDVGPGGAALMGLAGVDVRGLDPAIRGVAVEVASDVDNPLVGPDGASAVYGPQKGATPQDVAMLDLALARFAGVVKSHLGVEVASMPGTGAAGGIGASLVAFLGATFRSGVELVMEAVGFGERLRAADLVVTGEGAFDEQSIRGKVAGAVLSAAAAAGIPAVVLCGRATVTPAGATVRSLVDRFGMEAATGAPAERLADLAAEIAGDLGRVGASG